MTAPRFELTSQRQKVSRLPNEPPGRHNEWYRRFPTRVPCAGLTMSSLLPVLEARGTKSLRVTSLLEKRTARSCGYKADYVGFSIPDKFVVGFCLDFNEAFRRATDRDAVEKMKYRGRL